MVGILDSKDQKWRLRLKTDSPAQLRANAQATDVGSTLIMSFLLIVKICHLNRSRTEPAGMKQRSHEAGRVLSPYMMSG